MRDGQCRAASRRHAHQVTGRVRRFANKSESVVLAPEFSDEGDSRKGRGAASEPNCWREEEEEEEKAEEAESIVPFLAPFSAFPRVFFSVPFPSPHFIPVHHAVPSTSPKPPQTHRPVLRCAPLLAALHIAFCPLYYVFGHYNRGEESRERERKHMNTRKRWSKDQVAL